jgi:hypothetical protein
MDSRCQVAQLSNGLRNIDLVVSASETAVDTIFTFHSTPVMNFISGYGIFSAYPLLTLQNKGFVHPDFLLDHQTPLSRPVSKNTVAADSKIFIPQR